MSNLVARSQLFLALAHGARLLLFVLLTALLGRRLAPTEFAFVSWVIGLYVLAMEVLDMGTSAMAARDVAAQPASEITVVATLLALRRRLATALTVLVLGLAATPLVADDAHRLAMVVAAGGIFLLHLHGYQPVFQRRQYYGRVLALGLVTQLAFVAASAAALQAHAGGATIVVLIALREAAAALASRWVAIRLLGRSLPADRNSAGMWRLWQRGWMIGVAGVGYKLVVFGGVFILYRPDSLDALATYSAAHRLMVPSIDLAWLIVNPLFASLSVAAVHGEQALRDQLTGHVKLLLGLACLVAVAATVLAPFALRLFYGEAYVSGPGSAVGPFRWLALGGLFAWVTPVLVVAETTRGQARALLALSLTCVALAAAGYFWALPRHGAAGAAMVLCGCEALVFCALLTRCTARGELQLNVEWLNYLVPALVLALAMQLLKGSATAQGLLAAASVPLSMLWLSKLPSQRACRSSIEMTSAALQRSPGTTSDVLRRSSP